MVMRVLMRMVSQIVRRLSMTNVTSTLKKEIQMELVDERIIAQKLATAEKARSNSMVSANAKTSKLLKKYVLLSV